MIIFGSRNPFSIAIILVSIIAVSAVVYAIGYFDTEAHTVVEMEKNEWAWKSNRPQNFRYTLTEGCMSVKISEVIVISGKTSFLSSSGNDERSSGSVIEDIFLELKTAILTAHSVNVNYHKEFGYPEKVSIDWRENVIDDECSYSVSNFTVLELVSGEQ